MRVLEAILSIGATPTESESRRSGRRVFMLAFIVATLISIPATIARFTDGYPWVGVVDVTTTVVPILLLVVIARRPAAYEPTMHLIFFFLMAGSFVDTAMFGGLLPSGTLVLFNLDVALAALIAIDLRAGLIWFTVFSLSVVYAVAVPHWIDPTYTLHDPTGDTAFALIATGIVTAAVVVYFVRQRDFYQERSDALLHAILPREIATKLKEEPGTIADDVASASVLFGDVVDFTPMSASMSPPELVELLDELFTAFDALVADLGLEKVKTIGDAYMVAAGVPHERSDHAHAIAELALRMRDHTVEHPIAGRRLLLRIGIDSGPLVAGVIGTDKFAYDLWGDTVNTASRMESHGVPGAIQISQRTYELISGEYICEPRGVIEVKGKERMETYLLLSRHADAPHRTSDATIDADRA